MSILGVVIAPHPPTETNEAKNRMAKTVILFFIH